ncbi:cyclin-P [Eucyclogobius newberryi]|uniref:cyclin-P n=1 Tax=Eucyclogobius newberryi TaxID=166745 RepID=UPI003B5A1057
MAGAGFCDSRPLLDLHQKADDRRALCKPWRFIDEYAESRMASLNLECRWDALHALVPTLLRREVEIALEKLNFIWDPTYAWEMFLDMMQSQASDTFSNKDLPSYFTDATRRILVDWLIKVHEMMHFQDETLYLAIHLLNRSLCLLKVSIANLQLLGMVCLFIAAKKEESLLPEVSDLCYVMDYTYTPRELLRLERKVLSRLKFDLAYCAPLHFLLLFASVARCSAKMTWMARFLLELALSEGQCVVFQPVQLAEAALCLARLILKEPPTPEGEAAWCLVSSLHVGNEPALLRIMQILATAAATAPGEICASYIKFSSPETMHVSRDPGLVNASLLLGVHK